MDADEKVSGNKAKASKWVEKYAVLIEQLYILWQEPLGIDDSYQKHLRQELLEDYGNPLKKALVESLF